MRWNYYSCSNSWLTKKWNLFIVRQIINWLISSRSHLMRPNSSTFEVSLWQSRNLTQMIDISNRGQVNKAWSTCIWFTISEQSMEYMYLIHNQVIRFIDFCSVWKNQNRSNIGDSFHQFVLRLLEYYGVLPAREWSRVAIQARTVIREQTRNRESTVVHQGIPLPDSHFGCSLKFPSRLLSLILLSCATSPKTTRAT